MSIVATRAAEPGPDLADMPAQLPREPADAAGARARFFNSGNAFNLKLPGVPAAAFRDEAALALASPRRTALVACDQSGALGLAGPATTPLMLARYVTLAPDATLSTDFAATGSIWYVIDGSGSARSEADAVDWAGGDVFLFPGGPLRLRAGPGGAVLWVVTNEPQLALDGSRPPPAAAALVRSVHYPAAEIERQIGIIYEASRNDGTAGMALIFSSGELETSRNILPSLTLSLNTLPGGEAQRAHRHNSAAITLVVQGRDSFSTVDGRRIAWTPWTTVVTPPGSTHSHHNDGRGRALFLIVQDGGLHYHARTMGFSFLD